MNNTSANETLSSATEKYSSIARRRKRIKNIKTGGDLMMYVGSAGLMMPVIRKAREQENGVMGICAFGAGTVLAIGLGNLASSILNKTIDKVVDFWDDVKPNGPAKKVQKKAEDPEAPEEDKDDG